MITRRHILGAVLATSIVSPAEAHTLEEVEQDISTREKYFQAADRDAPDFDLQDADGKAVKLSDFKGKIVVLHFIYTNCPDTCPLHAEKIAEIQKMVNISPMKAQVQFVSITTDPKRDNGQILRDFGENRGLDPANWVFLTAKPSQPEDVTRELAKSYGVDFATAEDGEQVHGVLTSVIDQKGRLRGRFHSLRFANVNLVIFVNALINFAAERHNRPVPGLWDRLWNWF